MSILEKSRASKLSSQEQSNKKLQSKKNKEKSSKQVASILKNSTINLFCENTESQWKELAKMKKLNEAIVDVLDFIK